jgi:DNA-binding PadR family transcriptional regulator
MHGHQIRHNAQTDRTELWSDVKVGSLYGALRRMAVEGLIEEVRTEQEGNLPARTIYQITEDGRLELEALRDATLRNTRLAPDPVDLALQVGEDMPPHQLRSAIEDRLLALSAELERWRRLREMSAPYLTPVESLGFDHTSMRLETEVAWHERLLKELPAPPRDGAETSADQEDRHDREES